MSNHTSGESYLGIFWVSDTAKAAYPTGLKYSALSVAIVASCVGLSAATLVLAGGNKTNEEDRHQQHQDDSGSSDGSSDASPLAYLEKFGTAMGISAVTVSAVALVVVAGIVACLYTKQAYIVADTKDVPFLIATISACMAVVGILSLIFGSVVAASSSSSSLNGEDDDGADAAAVAAGVSYALIGVSAVAIICAITDPFKWGKHVEGGQTFSSSMPGPTMSRENPDDTQDTEQRD